MSHFPPMAVLDIKGLLLHTHHAGTDKEHGIRLPDGKIVNSPNHSLRGFIDRYLKPLLTNYAPINVIAVWDDGIEYRRRLFPGYKARRQQERGERPPEVEKAQAQVMKSAEAIMLALGIAQVRVKHTEADDVIAFLADRLPCPLLIETNDVDIMQLHTPAEMVEQADYMGVDFWARVVHCKGQEDGDCAVIDGHDIPVDLVRLYKAICGDASDEYGGVRGCGPAFFQKLMAAYDTPSLLAMAERIASFRLESVRKAALRAGDDRLIPKLLDNAEDFARCWDLAGLHPELCETVIDEDIRRLKWRRQLPSAEMLQAALDEVGLGYLMEDFRQFLPTQTLITPRRLNKAMAFARQHAEPGQPIAFDFEGYDELKWEPFQRAKSASSGEYIDTLSQVPTGCSIAFGNNLQHAFYLPTLHKDTDNLEPTVVVEQLKSLASSDYSSGSGSTWVCHNAGFERTVALTRWDWEMAPVIDTIPMMAYADESRIEGGGLGLKQLALDLFGYRQTTYEDLLQHYEAQDMRDLTGDQVLAYGCDDSFVTAHLHHFLRIVLACEQQLDFFERYEPEIVGILSDRFIAGTVIDFDRMAELETEDKKAIEEGTAELYRLLREHCSEPNHAGVQAMLDQELPYLTKLYTQEYEAKLEEFRQGSGKRPQDDYVQVKIGRYKAKLLDNSCFQPAKPAEVKPVEFKPTKLQIGAVLKALGAPDEVIEQLPSSFTPGTINKWLFIVKHVTVEGKGRVRFRMFCDLLAQAASEMKDRAGESYDGFAALCITVLEEAQATEAARKAAETPPDLNLNSADQMKALLYVMLGLPVRVFGRVKAGDTRYKLGFSEGAPSTDDKARDTAIAFDCPDPGDWRRQVLEAVKKVKKAEKRFEMYYTKFPLWTHPIDGRCHPGTKNPGTVTRRPSGSNYNLYQLGKKGDAQIRDTHLPLHPDHVFIDPDFSGQELRITASESNDPTMLDAYIGPKPKDIHSVTAAAIASVLLPRLHPELSSQLRDAGLLSVGHELGFRGIEPLNFITMRKGKFMDERLQAKGFDFGLLEKACNEVRDEYAKAANFLITYVGGPGTLARNLGCSIDVAREIMDMVFDTYARLRPWQDEVKEEARTYGFVTTAYGTRKHLDHMLFSSDRGMASRAERQAVNQKVQGCAADMLKLVLTRCSEERLLGPRSDYGRHAVLVAPIYDELLISVHKDVALEFAQRLMPLMRVTPPGHKVPMAPELDIGLHSFLPSRMAGFGADPDWEKVGELLLTKQTSTSRFYLPDWFQKEAA